MSPSPHIMQVESTFRILLLQKGRIWMLKQTMEIHHIPALLCGDPTDRVILFVHGQGGNKEEAIPFAERAVLYGYQVLSIDLPEHGERQDRTKLLPWKVIPELHAVMQYATAHWTQIAVRATSIGAYFALLAFAGESIPLSLLVSPLLDMEAMIDSMMAQAGVTEAQLFREKEVPTSFGPTLSWEYLCWARAHPVRALGPATHILYAENDALIPRAVIDRFTQQSNAGLTVMPGGEHWFHTPDQLVFLRDWEQRVLSDFSAQREEEPR